MDEVILLMESVKRKQITQFWSHVDKTPEGYEQAIHVLLKIVPQEDLQSILDRIDDWESIIWTESEDQ